jgi:hypothetical protein
MTQGSSCSSHVAMSAKRSLLAFYGGVFALSLPLWWLGALVETKELPIALPASALMAFCPLLVAALLVLGWVVVGNLARLRFFSAQDIHGASATSESETVRVERAVLQNTVEQALLAVPVQWALELLLPTQQLGILYALSGLFCVGRLAFWLGYRRGAGARSFGFAATFYPTAVAWGCALGLAYAT